MYFITSNKGKLAEVRLFFPDVEVLHLDLPEVQSLDSKEIIQNKLQEALKHIEGCVLVEDTAVYSEVLKGLPGPLIKWFKETLGPQGLYEMLNKLGNTRVMARTTAGYATSTGDMHFFEGEVKGCFVEPRGENGFGWDVIFKPDGYECTFAELSREEKNKISMRRQALQKLKDFLNANMA